MSKIVEKIPTIIAITLVSVSVILVLLIYVGGSGESIYNSAGELMSVPRFTDVLIYWTYFLVALTIIITLVMVGRTNIKSYIINPKSAIKSLIPIILFILVFVLSWIFGSSEEVKIIGYDGNQNVGDWARFCDMMIYPVYVMLIALILTIIGAQIYKSLK